MITDADIKKIGKVFVTKKDAKSFATKEDLINFKDDILSEIIKLREDIEVIIGYRDRIEDHDQRIEKLETTIYH